MPFLRSKLTSISDYWPALIFIGLLAIEIALKHKFTLFDLRSLCVNALPLVILALGQFLVVLTRGVDLSLGPIASVSSVVMALTASDNVAVGLVVPVLIGLAAGLVNGVLIAGLRLPPIIVTLATMSIWQGVASVILPDPGGGVPPDLQELLVGGFGSPTVGFSALIVFTLVVTWLMSSRFGLHLRAVGGDEQAAQMSGVRVRSAKIWAYVFAGLLAALAGIYLTAVTTTGSPTGGDGYILTSIAAVVIGGVPLKGGKGTALGVTMGALILTITGSILYYAGISSFYQSVIDGVILLAIVSSGAVRDFVGKVVRT
jgi:ribose transport system permease protein